MGKAVQAEFAEADILIMAAAVADFKPAEYADQKNQEGSRKGRYDLRPQQNNGYR